jgi:diadenosine tetraphosphate (Ap4A) HIT family hydrolase
MVDPHVHFHVFPRYASERTVCGLTLVDSGWPKAPDMTAPVQLSDEQIAELVKRVQSYWPDPSI